MFLQKRLSGGENKNKMPKVVESMKNMKIKPPKARLFLFLAVA